MPKLHYLQSNFNSGVLDPRLAGRLDVRHFYNGMYVGENVVCMTQGGVRRRDGLRYIDTLPSSDNVRLIPFVFNTSITYLLAFTDMEVRVYQDGALIDTVATPYAGTDLAEMDVTQSADTMIIVHESYAPRRLVRGASWALSTITFTNVPQFDFNDASSPTPTADVQDIDFNNGAGFFGTAGEGWREGDTFRLDIEGAITGEITYAGHSTSDQQEATAQHIADAIQNVYTVGLTGVTVTSTGATTNGWGFRVTLGEDSAKDYKKFTVIPGSVASAKSVGDVTKVTDGVPRTEDVWSATRGYPRTCTFFEGRLWFGGTTFKPNSIFASVVNDFFNFQLGEGFDDDAIFLTIATDQLNVIQAIYAGRDLHLFTSGAEFTFPPDVLTPSTAAPSRQTAYGAARQKPILIDGATLYLQRTGKTLREFLYNINEEAYASPPLSVLAPHLLNNVVDMAAWQGSGIDDSNYVFCVNGDGTVAVLNTLRSQDITAWTHWTTAGEFKAVGVVDEDIYFAVQRTINGTSKLFLEQLDGDCRLDAAVLYSGASDSTISGVSHLNGEACRARSGNDILANVTPSGGIATLAEAVTTAEIGLDWTPTITTMPLNNDFAGGPNFLRKKRLVKVRLYAYESLGIIINGDRLEDLELDVDDFDAAPNPFTGARELDMSSNWSHEPLFITFTQTDPLPLSILLIDAHVETS